MKNCIVCGVELSKENTNWYKIKNHIYKCKDCIKVENREYAKKRREEDPKAARHRSKKSKDKFKLENPVKYSASQMRSSARKRALPLKIDFEISVDYIVSISPKICPVMGCEIKYGGGEKSNFSASIDRINPDKGYIEGNVQVICLLANLMKSSASIEQMKSFAAWVNKTY